MQSKKSDQRGVKKRNSPRSGNSAKNEDLQPVQNIVIVEGDESQKETHIHTAHRF